MEVFNQLTHIKQLKVWYLQIIFYVFRVHQNKIEGRNEQSPFRSYLLFCTNWALPTLMSYDTHTLYKLEGHQRTPSALYCSSLDYISPHLVGIKSPVIVEEIYKNLLMFSIIQFIYQVSGLDWPILKRWDVPWKWQTVSLTSLACGLRLTFFIFSSKFKHACLGLFTLARLEEHLCLQLSLPCKVSE